MLFQQPLYQPAHTGSGALSFLPVNSAVFPQQICQLFCNRNQFVMLIKILDGLGLGERIIERQFLGGQPQFFALCVGGSNVLGQLQKLLNDFLVGQHPVEIAVHGTLDDL